MAVSSTRVPRTFGPDTAPDTSVYRGVYRGAVSTGETVGSWAKKARKRCGRHLKDQEETKLRAFNE